MRQTLRRELTRAIKARDIPAVAALRSALAAIENAEAVDVPPPPPTPTPTAAHPAVAGSVVGLGAADVPRRPLTDLEVADVVTAEVEERLSAAAAYQRLGHGERADRLRSEAAVLAQYVRPRLAAGDGS